MLAAMALSEPDPGPDSTHRFLVSDPTSVSVPAPPAMSRLTDSAVVRVNTSAAVPPLIFSVAVNLAKPLAAPALTLPASVPVMLQALAVFGPTSWSSPLPPSIWPASDPVVASVNTSSPPRPVRFSTLSNCVTAVDAAVAEPLLTLLMAHAVSTSGPISVSVPTPPRIVRVMPAPRSSTVKRSSPSPPETVRFVTPTVALPKVTLVSTDASSMYVRSITTPPLPEPADTRWIPTTSSLPVKLAL